MMMHRSLEAAKILEAEGIDVEVIDLRTLVPYDKETILASVEKTARAVVVYESSKTMGVGAEIGAMIAEDGFQFLDAPEDKRLAWADLRKIMSFLGLPRGKAAYRCPAHETGCALRC